MVKVLVCCLTEPANQLTLCANIQGMVELILINLITNLWVLDILLA